MRLQRYLISGREIVLPIKVSLKVRHTFIHAGRPQTNGCVERVQGTILQECWKPAFAR